MSPLLDPLNTSVFGHTLPCKAFDEGRNLDPCHFVQGTCDLFSVALVLDVQAEELACVGFLFLGSSVTADIVPSPVRLRKTHLLRISVFVRLVQPEGVEYLCCVVDGTEQRAVNCGVRGSLYAAIHAAGDR